MLYRAKVCKHLSGSSMTLAMILHSYVPYSSYLFLEEMSGSQIFAPSHSFSVLLTEGMEIQRTQD